MKQKTKDILKQIGYLEMGIILIIIVLIIGCLITSRPVSNLSNYSPIVIIAMVCILGVAFVLTWCITEKELKMNNK